MRDTQTPGTRQNETRGFQCPQKRIFGTNQYTNLLEKENRLQPRQKPDRKKRLKPTFCDFDFLRMIAESPQWFWICGLAPKCSNLHILSVGFRTGEVFIYIFNILFYKGVVRLMPTFDDFNAYV